MSVVEERYALELQLELLNSCEELADTLRGLGKEGSGQRLRLLGNQVYSLIGALLSDQRELARQLEELRVAARAFTRYTGNMAGRGDEECTQVKVELSQEETEASHAAILAIHPHVRFGPGRDELVVAMDGLKVRHWRALERGVKG